MEGLGAQFVPWPERVRTLANIAAARLRVGGRLVFLMPVEAADIKGRAAADGRGVETGGGGVRAPPLPPGMPTCLSVESISWEVLSLKMDRALVTMVKTGVSEGACESEGVRS